MAEKRVGLKYFYSWPEFAEDAGKMLAWAKKKKIKSVYGIPRGGLTAAVVLSYGLNLPMTFSEEEINEKTLVVDDIIDSGKSVAELEAKLKFRPLAACLFCGKKTERRPDFFAREKTAWVVFPWETEKSSRRDKTLSI